MTEHELDAAKASCDACDARDRVGPADRTKMLDELVKIGYQHFGGKAKTDYTDYVCRICGREWTYVEDSGLGGHAWFLHAGRMR